MGAILLVTILCGAGVLVALLLWSMAAPHLRVWPLPDQGGAAVGIRRALHRLSGTLIGVLSAGALVLAVVERHTLPAASVAVSIVGWLVFCLGATLGLLGYLTLGPAMSHGQPGPLVATGTYRFSRNPQYVGAILVLLGFATALSSSSGLIAALACSTWFALAPFAEESWLREKLGASYAAYVHSAPRYLGLPSRKDQA